MRLDAEEKSDYEAVKAGLETELKQKPIQEEDVDAFLAKLRADAEVDKRF